MSCTEALVQSNMVMNHLRDSCHVYIANLVRMLTGFPRMYFKETTIMTIKNSPTDVCRYNRPTYQFEYQLVFMVTYQCVVLFILVACLFVSCIHLRSFSSYVIWYFLFQNLSKRRDFGT